MRRLDEVHAAGGDLAERAFDLDMARVADQHRLTALAHVLCNFMVHFRNQRTGRVDRLQLARARLLHHRTGHPVR